MKSTLLALAFLSKAVAQESASCNFIVEGKIEHDNTKKLVLSYFNHQGKYISDTQQVHNGQFRFKGQINYPVRASLAGNIKSRSISDLNFVEFFLSPSIMNVKIKENEFSKITITNSVTQNEAQQLAIAKKNIEEKRVKLGVRIEELKVTIAKSSSAQIKEIVQKEFDSVLQKFRSYDPEIEKVEIEFIKNNPESFLTPYVLQPYIYKMHPDSLLQIFNRQSNTVKDTYWSKQNLDEIIKKKNSIKGAVAPVFQAVSIDSQIIDLAAYRYKNVILLDFWASWCVPCRRTFPELKRIYKEYSDKGFEIISISQDFNLDQWKKAIIDDSIGMWQHVLIAKDLKNTYNGRRNPDDIIEKYFVNGIPLQMLIDKEGIIVKRWDGENMKNLFELEEYLKQL